MLTLPPSVRFYSAVEPGDLRRGHDGLSGIVRGQWGMDLFAGHLFVFLGRRADRCKILFWDRGGLVLYYKRLGYSLKNWQALMRFITNVEIPPDNNRSERSLRVVALGRKTFLFAGDKEAG